MHIVVAVDWRDQSQSALQEVVDLYKPNELTLVHAVHLGSLESPPPIADVMDHEAYQEFERAKRLFMDQAEAQLQQLAAHVQQDVPAVKPVSAGGDPERVILQVVASTAADLVVVGHRGLGQFAEFAMGSVSQLVLLHAPCATPSRQRVSEEASAGDRRRQRSGRCRTDHRLASGPSLPTPHGARGPARGAAPSL